MVHERLASVLFTGSLLGLIAACSSSPSTQAPPAAATPVGAEVAAAPAQPAPPSAAPVADTINGEPLSPERILVLQKLGYTFMDKDGQTYACRKDAKTGSRLARETICMTPQEAEALRVATQRGLSEMMRNVPPPQGR